jgi:hypothetical protein
MLHVTTFVHGYNSKSELSSTRPRRSPAITGRTNEKQAASGTFPREGIKLSCGPQRADAPGMTAPTNGLFEVEPCAAFSLETIVKAGECTA